MQEINDGRRPVSVDVEAEVVLRKNGSNNYDGLKNTQGRSIES